MVHARGKDDHVPGVHGDAYPLVILVSDIKVAGALQAQPVNNKGGSSRVKCGNDEAKADACTSTHGCLPHYACDNTCLISSSVCKCSSKKIFNLAS